MTTRLDRLPARLDAVALADVIAGLGLPTPHFARDFPLDVSAISTAGQHYSVRQVDAALAETEFSIEDRLALKSALRATGLLAR